MSLPEIRKPLLQLGTHTKFTVKGEPVHVRVMDCKLERDSFRYYLGENMAEGAWFYEEQLRPFIERR